MKLVNTTRDRLLRYIESQLHNFFPDGDEVLPALQDHIDEALVRLHKLIKHVRPWPENEFDPLHSTQYSIFLYLLANTVWRRGGSRRVCTKLFLLNKALNSIDLFYEIEMPDVFFIGHTVGIVLAKATYGSHLVLYQNSTVGKNYGVAPVLDEGVIMFPNTAIIGRCHVRSRTIVAQGASVINKDTPGDCVVFSGESGQLTFKPATHDILADIFR